MYRIILFLALFTGCSIVDSQDATAIIGTWQFTSGTRQTTLVLGRDERYTFTETQASTVTISSQGTYKLGVLTSRQAIVFFNDAGTSPVSQVFFFVDDSTDQLVTSSHPNFTSPQHWIRR